LPAVMGTFGPLSEHDPRGDQPRAVKKPVMDLRLDRRRKVRRESIAPISCAAVCAALAGCGGPLSGDTAWNARVSRGPLCAAEGDDQAGPSGKPGPFPCRPRAPIKLHVGLRAGYATPCFTGWDYEGGAFGGPYVLLTRETSRFSCEAGFDLSHMKGAAGYFASNVFALRCDLLYAPWGRKARGHFYVASGAGCVGEFVQDKTSKERWQNSAGVLNLSAGVFLARGWVDLRFTYGVLLGNRNAAGLAAFTAGVCY